MAVAEYLKFLLAASFAIGVTADGGDDFSNNLFSDLAPLLALFGERVTMQFMSQSMGWADNIVLAMVPLGILTIIVSAIRVGGPSWLKVIIGRARENLAVAEQELMSSTSAEVCELWNGLEVVRCMGSAPIIEFICLLPSPDQKTDPATYPIVKTLDLETAKKEKHLAEFEINRWNGIDRWLRRRNACDSLNMEAGQVVNNSAPSVIIVRNKSADAPNISLNCHGQFDRGDLHTVAVIGTVLQLGILAYSACITYYPTLRFSKEDRPVQDYAFPCTAAGTVVLVAGMLLCAHVVEGSTEENRYRPCCGKEARLVWLQQTKTVSDQVFSSFATFASDKRIYITTSHRMNKKGRTLLMLKAVVGTMVGACGFVVQFIGLRGMHWSVSVVQLGAVLIMTALRAWVRRGLAKPLKCEPLLPGFELDWFAMTLGDITQAPWLHPSKADGNQHSRPGNSSSWDWNIKAIKSVDSYQPLHRVGAKNNTIHEEWSPLSMMHWVMTIRRDLGELADWRGFTSVEAIAVARAIEITMDSLGGLIDIASGKCTWAVPSGRCTGAVDVDDNSVHFRLERQQNGAWKAYSDEIEAALSLWLYSVSEKENGQKQGGENKVSNNHSRERPHKDDKWLRATGSPTKLSLRLLGPSTADLCRDLHWWMPRDAGRVIEVKKEEEGKLEVESHRIIGSGSNSEDASQGLHTKTRFKSHDLMPFSFGPAQMDLGQGNAKGFLLATESYDSLKLLYAQDLFSSFMWVVAKTMKPFSGNADIRPNDISDNNTWQSFTLRYDKLSKLIQDTHGTGIGTLEDVYLSIIPPLSVEQKLPQADAIVELARQHAKPNEQLGRWKEAIDVYLRLFQMARTFPGDSGIAAKATAILLEYLRQVTFAIDLRRAQCEENALKWLVDLKSTLENELNTETTGILSSLMSLYEKQGRGWKCDLMEEKTSTSEEETSSGKAEATYPSVFNFTNLHKYTDIQTVYFNPDIKTREALSDKEQVNARDIHGWTPLHYTAARGNVWATRDLLDSQADFNARDLMDWTPLHYACQRAGVNIVRSLLGRGADINAQGRDGLVPFHCAAISGHQEVVQLLAESGAALDLLDVWGYSPLLWAAHNGHVDVTAYLWEDANKKLRDRKGRTALHIAASSGQEEVVRWLIEKKADLEAMDRNGHTPLCDAVVKGNKNMVRLLVELGANMEAKGEVFGTTPLYYAVKNKDEDVINLLVRLGANLEAKDRPLESLPLHYAVEGGDEDIVRLLIEKGAEKDKDNVLGRTPLHSAVNIESEDMVRLLIEKGAERDVKNRFGSTPLHYAVAEEKEEMVRLLIDEGAEKDAKDSLGLTSLHMAVNQENEKMVGLLVEKGADKNARNLSLETPMDLAVEKCNEAIVALLE